MRPRSTREPLFTDLRFSPRPPPLRPTCHSVLMKLRTVFLLLSHTYYDSLHSSPILIVSQRWEGGWKG